MSALAFDADRVYGVSHDLRTVVVKRLPRCACAV